MSDEPFFFTWSAQRAARGVEIVSGDGAWFVDADGARWLDLGSLTYHANLGHGHARMVAAVREQADRLCLTMPKAIYPQKRELAERLLALAGPSFSKVFFCLGGSDANENAMKIARLATGRHKVVSRYRSYHGASLGALSLTGDYRRPPLEPLVPGAVKVLDCHCDECPFGQRVESCARECAAQFDDVLRMEGNVGAVFLEPVPGANGVLIPPDDYWPKVRAACDAHGALLVADEVLCGFGRLGRWFGHQRWDAVPDMITVSKGLTAGYGVLGAVIVSERVAAHFEDQALLAGLTQYAHPLGVAAALEAIRVYDEDGLIARADETGRWLGEELEGLASRSPAIRRVRSIGLLSAIELDPAVVDDAAWARVPAALRQARVHCFSRDRTIILAPPLVIEEADLAEGLRRIEAVLGGLSG